MHLLLMVELYIRSNTICIEFDLDDHYAVPLPYGYSYMYDNYHNMSANDEMRDEMREKALETLIEKR